MPAITDLRNALATALANDHVWTVYAFPPASPIANCIIISPDSPYLEAQNNLATTIAPKANLKLTIVVPNIDNQGSLDTLESFMVQVIQKLAAATAFNIVIGSLSAPSQTPSEEGSMLMADLSISTMTTWS